MRRVWADGRCLGRSVVFWSGLGVCRQVLVGGRDLMIHLFFVIAEGVGPATTMGIHGVTSSH